MCPIVLLGSRCGGIVVDAVWGLCVGLDPVGVSIPLDLLRPVPHLWAWVVGAALDPLLQPRTVGSFGSAREAPVVDHRDALSEVVQSSGVVAELVTFLASKLVDAVVNVEILVAKL